MSKMGKLLLIFGIVAFVSAALFGISVAALGVRDSNYSISIGNTHFYAPFSFDLWGNSEVTFDDNGTSITQAFETGKEYSGTFDASQLRDIEISTASSQTQIICVSSDSDTASVKYVAGSSPLVFRAVLRDGKFTIEEKMRALNFTFGVTQPAKLEISLPEKAYGNVTLSAASGSTNAADLISDALNVNIASGSMEIGAYAKKISLSAASGHTVLRNCTDSAAESIVINTASGNQEIFGFKSANTDINTASGKVTVDGISGNVEADVTSGTLSLIYAEWNDELDIDLTSGKIDVTLPAGSGIGLDFEKTSGSMNIDLDGTSLSLGKDTYGTFGGSNVHEVSVDVTSGSVHLHN